MHPDTTPSPIVTSEVYGRSSQWVLEKSATLDVKWPGVAPKTSQVESKWA
jgi:hypothetical protein